MAFDIVDRIYEAAALPELWPDVFQDLSDEHGFAGAGMFTLNERFQRGVASPGIAEVLRRFLAEGWMAHNQRAPRTVALDYQGFVRDQDILSDEEMDADLLYTGLLRPSGLGYGAGSIIDCPNGDRVAISFEREGVRGPTPVEVLPQLDLLRPHLARAALFSARLDDERSQAQVAALSSLQLAAAVVTSSGRALAANAEFQALTAQVEVGARDAVRFSDPSVHALFVETLAQARVEAHAGRSVPIPANADGAPPAVLHVLPVRRAARDVFSRAAWLCVVTPLGQRVAPEASILSGLFDLTPAEARVARQLIEGRSVTDVATGFGVSESTIRNQLRAIFAKTGATRQSELVLLCGGGVSPR